MHNEKDNNSKGTANTRTKLSPIAIVLIVIAVIALFSVIIAGAVSSNNKKSGDNTVGMTLTEKNLKPQNNSSNNSVADRSLTKVEILMDDIGVFVINFEKTIDEYKILIKIEAKPKIIKNAKEFYEKRSALEKELTKEFSVTRWKTNSINVQALIEL